MKEHAKNALAHDIELFGKTVSTVAVAALFLIGAGSAAVLTSFGTVSGEADVTQAIQLDSNDGEASLSYSFTSVVGGDTTVDTYTITNNMDEAYDLTYSSDMVVDAGTTEELDQTGTNVQWSDSVGGIETTYAKYFDEAGHDFSGYSSKSGDVVVGTNGDFQSVSAAIDDSGTVEGDVVLVKSGSYNSFEVDKNITVVAENAPDSGSVATVNGDNSNDGTAIGTGVLVTADGATVKGFEVTANSGSSTCNGRGIDVQATDVNVESNYVHDVVAADRPIGIFVWGDTSDVSGTQVVNNRVEAVKATTLEGDCKAESKVKGIALDGDATQKGGQQNYAEDVVIEGNTIQDIGSSTDAAMASGVNVNGGVPKNFKIRYNDISDVDHNQDTTFDGGSARHPVAQAVYISGLDKVDSVDAPGSNHEVSHNNFELSNVEATTDVEYGYDSNTVIDANNNYWGQDGIQTQSSATSGIPDAVDASWSELGSVEPGSTTLAVVNDFPVYIDGSETYSLTTTVK